MAPTVDSVRPEQQVPQATDVAIIGGGIVGASAALFLAIRGIKAVLCEKGTVGGEQSSRNWGWVRSAGRDIRELPLMREASQIWSKLHQITGTDVGYRQNGVIYVAASERDLARRQAWLRNVGDLAAESRIVGQKELHELLPGMVSRYAGAIYAPKEGYAEPQKAAPAIARAAQARGASVLTNCAVRGLEMSGGQVSAVLTERGRIACKTVVLAGGAWSGLFCKRIGIRLPQLHVRASVMRSKPIEGPSSAVWAPGYAFRKRLDGGYTITSGSANRHDIVPDSFRYLVEFLPLIQIEWRNMEVRLGKKFMTDLAASRPWKMDETSPFEKIRVLDPTPVQSHLTGAVAKLTKAFPEFSGVQMAESWGGLIDAMPDAVPVISKTKIPGLIIATGFSGHGFGLGPGAGRLVADMVAGDTPIIDPEPFRLSRYSDGSKPRPTTGT